MVKEIQRNPETIFRITVRDEPVAEIRSAKVMVQAGEAVRKLLNLRQKLSFRFKGRTKEPISRRVKNHLYSQRNG
jgi:hypothetical protein